MRPLASLILSTPYLNHLTHAISTTTTTCQTPACLSLAQSYLSNFSPNATSLNPCTPLEFEELVCGGFRPRYDLDLLGKDNINVFNLLSQAGSEKLKGVLEGQYPGGSGHSLWSPRVLANNFGGEHEREVDEENFDLMKSAWGACMDVGAITEKGLEPIRELLGELERVFPSKFMGGGNRNGSGSDWTEAYMFVHRLGASGPLRVGIGTEVNDPGKKMVTVSSRASVGLGSGDLYKSESNVTEYTGILEDVLGKLYPQNSTFGATRKLAEDLVQFEKKLTQIGPAMGSRNASKSVSLSEASKLIPQINIEKIVRSLTPPDYNLKGVILDPTSLSNMSRILTDTAPDTIKTYFIWRTIAAVQDKVITPGVFDRWNKLRNNLDPANTPPADRARYCMNYINNGLGWLVSRFFIEGFFSAHDKQLSDQIIADLRHVYAEKFRTLTWMDDGTKKKATEKVEKMSQKVGYPTDNPNITSPLSLTQYYSSVSVTSSFFRNSLSLSNFSALQPWMTLSLPAGQTWYMLPTTVNAMYEPEYNSILFPAAILQAPFFGGDFPLAVNYGAFGAVAGHEISHAFDTTGGQYNADGRRVDWWGNETKKEYQRRIQCFKEQYNNFTVILPGQEEGKGFKVNGVRTLGENISDSAGLGVAFEAWRKRKGEKDREGLPGLERFTEEQLFFVAFANMWCSKYNEKGLAGYGRDSHAPPAVRIRGAVANSRAFREVFSCEVREPVCELW